MMVHKRQSRMRPLLPALLAMLLCGAPAFANRRALLDQVVQTPAGNFRITDLKCDHTVGVLIVQGKLVNDTSKSWNTLQLAMEFQDKNGNVVPKDGPVVLTYNPLVSPGLATPSRYIRNGSTFFGAGTTLTFNYHEILKADKDTFSVKFTFADGRYPVRYQTALDKFW